MAIHRPSKRPVDYARRARRFGLAAVGGLVVPQILTLLVTPVISIAAERFAVWCGGAGPSRLR